MYHVKVLKAADAEAAGRLAADQLQQAVCAKPACVLGLATGATPIPLYRELIRREQAGLMDFSRVRSVNLDEYKGLAPDHPQSYRRFMQENLFDHISIRPENTWVPDGMTTDVDAMCDGYERTIEELGGVDLQLLGLGHDGHIGFNEPCDEFPVRTHVVELTQSTINANSRLFESIDQVPREAYTMGIGTIMKARAILVVASGVDKAQIVRDAFFGPVTPQVPASVLQLHPNVTVVVDAEAGSLL